MTASLLSLVFDSLHRQASPVLWHTHCARYPEELERLLAQRILVPTTPATRLQANHIPGEEHPLEVKRVGEVWIGTFADDDDVHEVEVAEDYLLRYRIDVGAVATQLRREIGLRDGVSLRFDDGLLNLGDWASPDGPTRVYLAAPIPNPDALLARCRRLHALHPQRKIAVLTFAPVALEVSLEEEFERRLGFSLHCLRDTQGRAAWCPAWTRAPATTEPLPAADYVFRPVGDGWEVVFAGRSVSIDPSLVGLRYLHYLLTHPSSPTPAEELIATTNPHPDQVGRRGEITALASNPDDIGADAATLRRVRARQKELKAKIDTLPLSKRARLIAEFQENDAYLRANKSGPKKTSKAGNSKRVSVRNAITRVLRECPPKMRQHFTAPRLSLGYQPCYMPDDEIDWLT